MPAKSWTSLEKRTGQIASMFLLKAVFQGTLGGLIGSALCSLVFQVVSSMQVSSQSDFTIDFFQPSWPLLAMTILGAPIVTAMASYLPTRIAISQDPAIVLMDN